MDRARIAGIFECVGCAAEHIVSHPNQRIDASRPSDRAVLSVSVSGAASSLGLRWVWTSVAKTSSSASSMGGGGGGGGRAAGGERFRIDDLDAIRSAADAVALLKYCIGNGGMG